MNRRNFLTMIIRLPIAAILMKHVDSIDSMDDIYREFAKRLPDPPLSPLLKKIAIEIHNPNGSVWVYEQLIERIMESDGWVDMELNQEAEPTVWVELRGDAGIDPPKAQFKADNDDPLSGQFEVMLYDIEEDNIKAG